MFLSRLREIIDAWLGSPPPRSPERRLYYCYQNDCLDQPRPLQEMEFGCCKCESPRPLYDKLSQELLLRLPSDLGSLWSAQIKCPKHYAYNVIAFCPECQSPIFEHAYDPPIGIWGAGNAGKTVFCAVLAREIQTSLHSLTGLGNQFLIDRNGYNQEVVDKLYREGLLPAKTHFERHRKLVLRLHGENWLDRVLTLTDMAGEIYTERSEDLINPGQELARRQRTMLLVRDAIFLLDPENSRQLGATAALDYFSVLSDLLAAIQTRDVLLERHTAQVFVRRCQEILSRSQFPHNPGPNPKFSLLAREIAGLVRRETDTPALTASIQDLLQRWSPLLEADSHDPMAVLETIGNYVQLQGGAQLRHRRLAVVVTKADILKGIGVADIHQRYSEILNRSGARRQSMAQHWKEALEEISQISRDTLARSGMKTFVDQVTKQYLEVGFFFVSSLGRETEPFVQEGTVYLRSGSTLRAGMDQAAPEVVRGWVLNKRVRSDSLKGSRSPDPRFVLLPVLWLLTRTQR